jgi:hypothetical protein
VEQLNLVEEQVRANLRKVEQQLEFAGHRLWLTFYLCGPPERLEQVSAALGKSGWTNLEGWEAGFLYPKVQVEKTNLEGWEGGFLYPKVQVEKTVSSIVEAAQRAQQLCAEPGAEILNIDADTTPNMNSRCVTLYRSPA